MTTGSPPASDPFARPEPPIWRRLQVGSDLFLDDLHIVIQAAFGWTDSHLYRFGVGGPVWDHDTECYLCPFDADDGEDPGVPTSQVRLDEVLVDAGDQLQYVYDYGDDWEHRVRLEEAHDRDDDQPLVVCVGARRAGPPEDCGGIHGYQEMFADADVDPGRFDVEDVNVALARAGLQG